MMELIILLVLGGGAYWFFRGNIQRGKEVVRAYVFLDGLSHGEAVAEANRVVSYDMADGPIEVTLAAKDQLHRKFGGNSKDMIGLAYAKGMKPKLGGLTRTVFGIDATPIPDGPIEPTPDWVRPFVLYYVLTEMQEGPTWPTGAYQSTPRLKALSVGQITPEVEFSLNEVLATYMAYVQPGNSQFGIGPVVGDAHTYLREIIRAANSPSVVRAFIQKQHALDTGSTMPAEQLNDTIAKMKERFAEDRRAAQLWRDALLFDKAAEQFKQAQGTSYDEFVAGMRASSEAVRKNTTAETDRNAGQGVYSYDLYYGIYVAALKRLGGKAKDEFHPVDVMEDDNVRLAYRDGVNPLDLAEGVHNAHYKHLTRPDLADANG